MVSLSIAESELYTAVKNRVRGIGNSERGEGLGHCMWVLSLRLDATATMCLVNRRGLGKAKHVDMQNVWIQEASESKRFVTKKVGPRMPHTGAWLPLSSEEWVEAQPRRSRSRRYLGDDSYMDSGREMLIRMKTQVTPNEVDRMQKEGPEDQGEAERVE